MAFAERDAAQVVACHDRGQDRCIVLVHRLGDERFHDQVGDTALVRETPTLVLNVDRNELQANNRTGAQRVISGHDEQLGVIGRNAHQLVIVEEDEQAIRRVRLERQIEGRRADEVLDFILEARAA